MMMTATVFVSCGSKKAAVDTAGRVRRTVDPTYQLAQKEGKNLRAASSATSSLEDVALENAENAAVALLAGRIQSAIIGVRDRYNKTNQIDNRGLTEQEVQNHVKTYISQVLSYKVIGEPSIYDNPDKTITAYVCIELTQTTDKLLDDAYNRLTQDEILQTDFDRQKFIEENKEELKKLQGKLGL
ncbi:MAG: hypothetical protein IJP70_12030 [Bacteroidales bacterium]|nr:hypothetical protein [Bacteroidales bacterium]